MKHTKLLLLALTLASCLGVQTTTAEEAVQCVDIAEQALEKGLETIELGHYPGSLLLHGMAELATVRSEQKPDADPEMLQRTIDILKRFSTGEIEARGNFLCYEGGGNGAALLRYLELTEALDEQVARAAREMFAKQTRSHEGLMVRGWNPRSPEQLDQVFIDVAFAVTPYLLYAGLTEHNPEYVDHAVFQTLELFQILKDEASGLVHQGRGFNGPGSISEDNWSRGNGWGALAIAVLVRDLPQSHPRRAAVNKVATDFFQAVLRHQNGDGLWHQEMTDKTSFVETSGSGLLLYGIGIMLEKKLLPEKHRVDLVRGLQGYLGYISDDGSVTHACIGCLCPGKGTKADYARHAWKRNDPHAFGPVVLAFAQAASIGILEVKSLVTP